MPMNSGKDYKAREVEIAQPLMAGGPAGGNQGGDFVVQPIVVHGTQDPIIACNLAHTLGRNSGQENALLNSTMAVRRLMPVECERLQGFPDDYTDVPTGKKRAADGPRYKQLGNSWAVAHARWVGSRINAWLEANPAPVRRPVIEMQYDAELMFWAMVD